MGHADTRRLPPDVAALIADPANQIIISAVSVWEISIKHSLPRGRADDIVIPDAQALKYFRDAGYELLSVSPDHAAAVELLPRLHADPFGRLLAARALNEPLRLVTHDETLAAYGDAVMLF